MRLLLLCLCAVATLAEEVVDMAGDKPAMVNNVETLIKEVALGNKPWRKAIMELTPTAESLSLNLALNPGIVKPEIARAQNLTAELELWKKQANPTYLVFKNDEGQDVNAVVAEGLPIQPLIAVQDGVKFHFFNKYDENDIQGFQITDVDSLVHNGWDKELPVKFIIHGYTNTIKSPAIQLIKNAFLKTGKYNVVGVDWGKMCSGFWYPGAVGNVPKAGAFVGEFADKLVRNKLTDPSKLHFMGHSLGAHVAGIASKSMKEGVAARVTGLDPAGPLFELTGPDGIIYHTDAKLVDIIHTNAGFLGKTAILGDVDFYVNGGRHQPNCNNDVFGTCSHGRAVDLFAQSVKAKDGLEGFYCGNLPHNSDACRTRQTNERSYTAKMGYNIKFEKGGPYYVITPELVPL